MWNAFRKLKQLQLSTIQHTELLMKWQDYYLKQLTLDFAFTPPPQKKSLHMSRNKILSHSTWTFVFLMRTSWRWQQNKTSPWPQTHRPVARVTKIHHKHFNHSQHASVGWDTRWVCLICVTLWTMQLVGHKQRILKVKWLISSLAATLNTSYTELIPEDAKKKSKQIPRYYIEPRSKS